MVPRGAAHFTGAIAMSMQGQRLRYFAAEKAAVGGTP